MAHTSPIFKYLHIAHIVNLNDLHKLCILKQMYLIYANGVTPEPITGLFVRNRDVHDYETRQS